MIFGFNTDVPARDGVYHVQTEDRGAKNPVIESIIYVGGKIVGRRRTPYDSAEGKERIEDMVRRQHKDLVEAIRAGTWTPTDGAATVAATSSTKGYAIELLNPNEVRHGEYLRFRLAVREKSGSPASAVAVEVRWLLDGTEAERQSLLAKADGEAEVWFPAPAERMYATLLVCARGALGSEFVKFHVRGAHAD